MEGKYITYRNDRSILHVPVRLESCSLKFERKRVRMYSSIKLVFMTGDGLINFKTSKKKNSIVTTEQDVVLIFSRHFILRRQRGYTIVVEYNCPKGEFLYEVIPSPSLRYFSLCQ